MERSWMCIVATLALSALPLACSSEVVDEASARSVAELYCSTAVECSLLEEGMTEQTCVVQAEFSINLYRTIPGCEALAEIGQETIKCASELSCAERKGHGVGFFSDLDGCYDRDDKRRKEADASCDYER
jgi:hypothetical protein